jgi:hypothetical protein
VGAGFLGGLRARRGEMRGLGLGDGDGEARGDGVGDRLMGVPPIAAAVGRRRKRSDGFPSAMPKWIF